ncbi:hypothetical protein [Derxia lacustris]|uniref:hypothetical protein n=1 Tax=Derxia lacustris TaxID=764842 RepID=UPI000A173AB7|nr:hypothetical protein [Derxia lacustris]
MLADRLSLRARLLLAPLVAIALLTAFGSLALLAFDRETRSSAALVERQLGALHQAASLAPAIAETQAAARRLVQALAGAGDPPGPLAEAARTALGHSVDVVGRLQEADAALPAVADAARTYAFELRPWRGALADLLDPAALPDAASADAILGATERHADRLERRAGELADAVAAAVRQDGAARVEAGRAMLRGLLLLLALLLLPCLVVALAVLHSAEGDITLLAQLVARLREAGCAAERSAPAATSATAGAGAPAAASAADGPATDVGAEPASGARPPSPADFTGAMEALAFRSNLLALNAAVEAARLAAPGNAVASVAADARRLAQAATLMAEECRWQQRLADLDAAAAVLRAAEGSDSADLAEAFDGEARLPLRTGAHFSPPHAHQRRRGD